MIFADTSALYALVVADDAHHPDAQRAAEAVRGQREHLWTIDPVLTELWLLLRRDVGGETGDRIVDGLLARGLLREPLFPADYARALDIGRSWQDQRFSLTDRQAFATMERTRQLRAWSYDQDFVVIRLGPTRGWAVEIVR